MVEKQTPMNRYVSLSIALAMLIGAMFTVFAASSGGIYVK